MNSTTGQQDASLSAASFLASISAESSTSFGSTAPDSAASSAPALPISAKVSLIDAQIDALEGRIEQAVTAHAAQLRERAASTRLVDHDLNQLWRSINHASSRLVTVGPQLAPVAIEYHGALAQSSKQGLLLSVLEDLLAATRVLEKLEKLQHQSDLSALRAELPRASEVLAPFRSRAALQGLPAVAELKARFERLRTKCDEAETASRTVEPSKANPQTQIHATAAKGVNYTKDASATAPPPPPTPLSPALQVLEKARALIIARGTERAWKVVRIELDAPAPPPTIILPPQESQNEPPKSTFDSLSERLLRDDLAPESTSLTRNSSLSSATNARNRHKPKLGARVIRPQDQLGSGPFNAEDTPLEDDGWGLDDDDEEPAQPASGHAPPSSAAQHTPHSSSTSSISMQPTLSTSSSRSSAFAVQEEKPHAAASGPSTHNGGDDAWGLGEEHNDAGADAWDLEEDIAPRQQQPLTPKRAGLAVDSPARRAHAHTPSTAWGLVEDDASPPEPQPPPITAQPQPSSAGLSVPSPAKRAHAHTPSAAWNLDEDDDAAAQPMSPPKSAGLSVPSPAKRAHAHTPSSAWGLDADADEDVTEDDPWESMDQPAKELPLPAAPAPAVAKQVPVTPPRMSSRAIQVEAPTPPLPTRAESPRHTPVPTRVESPSRDAVPTKTASPSRALLSARVESPTRASLTTRTGSPRRTPGPTLTGSPRRAAEPFQQMQQAKPVLQVVEPIVDEPEEEAWGFDGDEAEPVPAAAAAVAPVQKLKSPAKPAPASTHVTTIQADSAKALGSTAPLPSHLNEAAAKESAALNSDHLRAEFGPSRESPPASPGWDQDFSFASSTGVPASDSFKSDRAILPTTKSSAPAVVKEDCTISQRSVDLIQLAETTLSLVIAALQAGGEGADEVEALAGTVFKMFELHRALMPVAHGETLRDVPALAMQFFNDCEYLARELTRLISGAGETIASSWTTRDAEAGKKWRTKELPKLEQEAASTRALGQRWFEAQMTAQSKILLDTLMEADGFARTFDEHRFGRCERCIKQVVHTLTQLGKAWQPVLVASRFYAALGRLVDLVFSKVLHDVLDLEDIGESESEKIASLVKTLGSLEALFTPEGAEASQAALWVASWFKTSYLIEILSGSLVDIEFLAFEAGALVDYSRKELTGLIKALFADTANRTKLLRRIEGAPVNVLAQ